MTSSLSTWSRRQFVKGAGLISAAAAAAASLLARDGYGSSWSTGARGTVYSQLGIRPLINAAGTYTVLSASTMPREVVRAMAEASRFHVSIP